MENLKKENETSRLRIEKLEDEIISKTPKPDQARMKKTLGEIELDSKLSIRVSFWSKLITKLVKKLVKKMITLILVSIEYSSNRKH